MVCKNCGACFPDENPKCDYCGAENLDITKKKKSDLYHDLQREKLDIYNIPKKIVRMSTSLLLKISVSIIILVVILLFLTYGTIIVNKKWQEQKREAAILKLETLYQAEDYSNLYNFMKEQSLWQDIYIKYIQVGDSYHYYESAQNILKDEIAYSSDTIYYLLADSQKCLRISKTASEDTIPLGNEDVLKEIYTKMSNILQKECKLTSKEIQELSGLQKAEKQNLLPYQIQIEERIQQQ